jgi:hypothetical protein
LIRVAVRHGSRFRSPKIVKIRGLSSFSRLAFERCDRKESIFEAPSIPLAQRLKDGHGAVLRAFAERMASAAVRNGDQGLLRKGLIALLLSSRSPDFRDTLMIFPLFYHAARRLGLDLGPFLDSIRQTIGDPFSAPFAEFLKRPETNKSLQVMGYAEGADNDGFRYIRNW